MLKNGVAEYQEFSAIERFTKERGLKPRPSRTAFILFDFSRLYQ
jgi:hypothetical protein